MDAQSRFDSKQSFVLDVPAVTSIWETLQKSDFQVEAVMDCGDGISRRTTLLNDVVNYSNPPKAQLESVKFHGYNRSKGNYATVFVGAEHSINLSFSLTGTAVQVSDTRERLVNIFDSIKPWYDRVTKLDFFVVLGLILIFGGMYSTLLSQSKPKADYTPLQAFYILGGSVALVVSGAALAWFLNKARSKIFPKAVFQIGHGIRREEFSEKIRWCVVVAFVVSIAAAFAFKPFS
ncbi:hypothetical protein [Pseudomonas coronafaciens]|uniref:Uncharacterized protein n=1 Tax=Pseudomonas coronafaciens pv. coronafaciens TaxID=235275 RepID=A0AAE6UNN4_9PSED|nr:hypothetical protein [Pseudomonas coronafaciens]QGT81328.1 hypothetical protein GMO17_09090 [Pseudomonas coronafaciens pv. coronafaciens]RMM77467.1 hypothetical protein ALQ71_00983 [Pseudomonas coronafaciens pv. striafaciens]